VYRQPTAERVDGQLNLMCSAEACGTIEFELLAWELSYTIKFDTSINLNTVLFNHVPIDGGMRP